MAKSLYSVSLLFVNNLLTKENNYITLSSCLKSSYPFKRKSYLILINFYSFPSDPYILNFRGFYLV